MPRKLGAASCAVNSLPTNLAHQYTGLWITNRLLEETFQNFCHSSRRYGSNVPGPLEARKRASKRRNTNLAYANAEGPHGFDPAVMLGSASKEKWWKKHEGSITRLEKDLIPERATSSVFTPWFLNLPEPPPKPLLDQRETQKLDEAAELFLPRSDLKPLKAELKHRISRMKKLETIHHVIQDMDLDLRQSPNLTEVVFRHLLEICKQTGVYDQLLLALYDPSLHPPGTSNHLLCVEQICSGPIARIVWERQLFPSLLKAVELGLVPANDLQKITLLIPKARKYMSSDRGSSKRLHSDWYRLLTSIEQSRVLQLTDMDHDFLSSWYRLISSTAQADHTCLLLWRLRNYSGTPETVLASELTVRILTHLSDNSEGRLEQLILWLRMLPADLLWSNTIQTTFKLIIAARDDQRESLKILDQWSELLPRLRSEYLGKFPFDQSTWTESSLTQCGLSSTERLLSTLWIAIRMWSDCPNAVTCFEDTKLRDQFRSIFEQIDKSAEFDRLSQVVLTIDMLPLPNKNDVFLHLQQFSDHELINLLGHEEYAEGLKGCLRLEYAQLQQHHSFKQAKNQYPEVLGALAESINTDLTAFQAMAQTLVLKNGENFRIVKRLLNHNQKLKFALSQSWNTDTIKETSNSSELDKTAVLEMIEKLIVTFSVTPVVSPRSSFKHVYQMYSFLHRVGAPTRPIVGRALWHAGVTRYGRAGASHTQVAWCLAKVREIEGEKVANRLLRSAGFRKSFVRDYVDTVKRLPFPVEVREQSLKLG